MLQSGRIGNNPKIQKSIGNLLYSQDIAFVGSGEIDSTTPVLLSPTTQNQALPVYTPQSTDTTIYFASESSNDTLLGTGAQILGIAGLDVNGLVASQTIQMNGKTPVASTIFSKVLEIAPLVIGTNTDADTGDAIFEGNIWAGYGSFSSGIPQYPIVGIRPQDNLLDTRTAITTIPADKLGFVKSILAFVEPDLIRNERGYIQLAYRFPGFPDNVWFKTPEYVFNGTYYYLFDSPAPLPPLTDVQVRARVDGNFSKKITCEVAIEWRQLV